MARIGVLRVSGGRIFVCGGSIGFVARVLIPGPTLTAATGPTAFTGTPTPPHGRSRTPWRRCRRGKQMLLNQGTGC